MKNTTSSLMVDGSTQNLRPNDGRLHSTTGNRHSRPEQPAHAPTPEKVRVLSAVMVGWLHQSKRAGQRAINWLIRLINELFNEFRRTFARTRAPRPARRASCHTAYVWGGGCGTKNQVSGRLRERTSDRLGRGRGQAASDRDYPSPRPVLVHTHPMPRRPGGRADNSA